MAKGRRAMARRTFSSATVGSLVAAAILVCIGSGQAQTSPTVASDRAAGLVVYPKIVVDTGDLFHVGRRADTVIQLTNTSSSTRVVHCFYVDATSHCSNGTNSFDPAQPGDNPSDPQHGRCRSQADCDQGGGCIPFWRAGDFSLVLSANQPLGWRVGGTGNVVPDDTTAQMQPIPPTSSFFVGELKCFEVDGTSAAGSSLTPINANDLKGEATIYEVSSGPGGSVDVRSYNAVGIQAVSANGATQNDRTMCLGSGASGCTAAEYASCPSTLVLDHPFDGLTPSGVVARTDVTFVPCTEDFVTIAANGATATAVQLLVFNEFEQRFSASTRINCFKETALSLIDTTPGNESQSIFNVNVQGTLTGQTRMRPVVNAQPGHGLLAVAEEFHSIGDSQGSAAYNVDYTAALPAGAGDSVRFVVAVP